MYNNPITLGKKKYYLLPSDWDWERFTKSAGWTSFWWDLWKIWTTLRKAFPTSVMIWENMLWLTNVWRELTLKTVAIFQFYKLWKNWNSTVVLKRIKLAFYNLKNVYQHTLSYLQSQLSLESDSQLPKKVVLFVWVKALEKWWKRLFDLS